MNTNRAKLNAVSCATHIANEVKNDFIFSLI